ncbi:SusD/RagB family nutrient-binding outer membrane lipoprotein [Terrimonas sp. NA20]|uniref:SusD/RagB family nutrient-binding outer membrane lipoprotein n=1 Tax=Terrimonas ginsenosidimutans TaxID=2908004 RepID=A0ABS9KT03_9BACT|nr:SusD/RagB family nutrient-binding outer membrane lipoprotein [Terrimonas ginsenosidimutans]MCG2615454.1 SusD/RagB family nutrient-binding outer membrane lipoprotein [Terrimonas ginsenosidimutans]
MKKLLIILFVCTLAGSCKKFIDVNHDPNNPQDVQEALLLAPVELAISHLQNGGKAAFIIQTYMQNSALAQDAPNTDTYRLANVELDGEWSDVYVRILNNLRILIQKSEASGKSNYVALGKILTAFTLGTATDIWGDIPYSQAFKGVDDLKPAYDKQEDIYKTMQQLLDDGIAEINKNHATIPGKDDLYYNGKMESWKRLAYTLKARYYMHLIKAPGYTAANQATLALDALQNGLQAVTDDFRMTYPGAAGQESPWFLNFQPRYTVVLASTFVDSLISRNDPRLSKIVKKSVSGGLYRGRVIGSTIESPDSYSFPTDFYAGIGAPNNLLTYSEALFLKSEATLIKAGFAAAQPIYTQAVQSNMTKLSVAAGDVNAYLATRGTLTAAKALQLIIEEKAIANYLSLETFTDWRRTGFPALSLVKNAVTTSIPRRLLYPQSEQINNPQPQQAAKLTDKVWWDN